jgi:hypothetical protein
MTGMSKKENQMENNQIAKAKALITEMRILETRRRFCPRKFRPIALRRAVQSTWMDLVTMKMRTKKHSRWRMRTSTIRSLTLTWKK